MKREAPPWHEPRRRYAGGGGQAPKRHRQTIGNDGTQSLRLKRDFISAMLVRLHRQTAGNGGTQSLRLKRDFISAMLVRLPDTLRP